MKNSESFFSFAHKARAGRLFRAALAACAFLLPFASSVPSSAATGAAIVARGDAHVIAQATAAATDAAATTANATQSDSGGLPWWVWVLAALVIAGAIYYFLNRRRRDPVITTTGTPRGGDPDITTRK